MGAIVLPKNGWRIHNYKKPEDIIMGFEYEIDTRANKAKIDLVNQLLPSHYSYAEETLEWGEPTGIEIKSSVAPLFTLRHEILRIWPLLAWTPPHNKKNNGGIHVNISVNDYTRTHYQKVFAFLTNTLHKEFFLALSHRTNSSFVNNCNQGCLFYGGIITTRKTYAYEFRLFKALPDLLPVSLEMSHAMFTLAASVNTITRANFIAFIHQHKKYSKISAVVDSVLSQREIAA